MKTLRKGLVLLTALTMLIAAVSCGSPGTTGPAPVDTTQGTTEGTVPGSDPATTSDGTTRDEGSEPATDPGTDSPSTPGGYDTPLTVSINVMDAEKCGKDARNEWVKEHFNLTFEYIPVSWGDWNDKIRTWVTTGDTPDLIWWDLKGATAWEYADWARQGAFTPYLPEDFEGRPEMKKVYETAESVNALMVDEKLYAWPSLRDNPPEAQNCYTSNWCYRRDWAKQVGLYKEGDVYTFEEWEALIAAVLEQNLAQAGLVMPPWGFPHAAVLFLSDPPAEGNETCSYIIDESTGLYIWPATTDAYAEGNETCSYIIDESTGLYIWPATTDAYAEGVKKTYDMFQAGLIYQDNIAFKGQEPEDMIKAGQAFATYNVTGSLNDWTTDMMRDGVLEKREDFGPAIVTGIQDTWYMTQTEDYWTVTALSKNIGEDEKARVLDFWNFLMTDDGRLLRNFGVEGKDWQRADNEEGFELLWPYDDELQDYVGPYSETRFNEANPAENGRTILPPKALRYQYDERDRVWSAFAASTPKSAIKPFDYDVSFLSAPNKDKFGSFNTDAKSKLIELIAQPGIDIVAEWKAWTASIESDVQLVLDELNSEILGK